jgi:hypothetical protein
VANASTSGSSRSWNGASRTDGSNPRRERTITRLAVLRSAVQLAAGRPDVKSTDVLRIAELFEQWVNR